MLFIRLFTEVIYKNIDTGPSLFVGEILENDIDISKLNLTAQFLQASWNSYYLEYFFQIFNIGNQICSMKLSHKNLRICFSSDF